jgi:hypothetical protein
MLRFIHEATVHTQAVPGEAGLLQELLALLQRCPVVLITEKYLCLLSTDFQIHKGSTDET